MQIRKAIIDDQVALRAFCEYTFRHQYSPHNTPEDMDDYCSQYFSQQAITHEIKEESILHFIAHENDRIVGYCKLALNLQPQLFTKPHPLQVARIYVHPEKKAKGIGKVLMHEIEKFCKDNAYQYLWLGVWQKNEDAIAFYSKMGFVIFGTEEFVLGKDVQQDWLMGKAILVDD